jgi:hypothetical protein
VIGDTIIVRKDRVGDGCERLVFRIAFDVDNIIVYVRVVGSVPECHVDG